MMPGSKQSGIPKRRRSISRLGQKKKQPADQSVALLSAQKRLLWAKLSASVLLLGSIWMLYVLFSDARFRVGEVRVEGTDLLQTEQVCQVVSVANTCSFWINTKELERRLQAEFGLIERVSVRCRLPNQLCVEVEEREAVLLWESGGRHWWVGADGEVLGAAHGADLITIHDVKGFASNPGKRIVGVPWTLAWEMVEALPAIKAYDYTSEAGLILYVTPAQWPVYLGHKGNARVKGAVLQALVHELVEQGVDVEYIDLRNERRPTYKHRERR